MPQPEVAPEEIQDWRPLLDRELDRLPEKYRAPLILCDLEGRSRKDVARQLQLPEGTLSSRLARARALLAKRLTRGGVLLSGAALAAALTQQASAVPAPLVNSTTRAALLVAAGQAVGATTPAAVLMKEVLKTMFLAKLKVAIGVLVVGAVLGMGGLAFQSGGGREAAQAAPPAGKPANELEALRKENELLKLNLEVVLEKVRAQEAELRTLRGRAAAAAHVKQLAVADNLTQELVKYRRAYVDLNAQFGATPPPDPTKEVEAALKALREAKDKDAKRGAADALEKALGKLKEQLK
jgi:hypothetical protein